MDQKTTIKSRSSISQKQDVPGISDIMKQFDWRKESKENLERFLKAIQDDLFEHESDKSLQEKSNDDISEIRKKLSEICYELLYGSQSDTEIISIRKQITEIENFYISMMEKFLIKMETFLYSCKELRGELEIAVDKFHKISHITACITLASSAVGMLLSAGSVINKLCNFSWYPKFSILSCIVGSVGISSALVALSYISRSSGKLSNDMRDKNRLFLDLIFLHRKGNWIDDEVLKLFPYGIDVHMLQEEDTETSRTVAIKMPWKPYLCSVILLTNMKKDKMLAEDENFLATVKMFIRSPAAEMWWCRLKIKKLLDDILKKIEGTSIRQLVSDHDVHFKQIVSYLYPVMIPFLFNSWNSDELRFVCCILVAILAGNDISDSGCEESELIKSTLNTFDKDFSEIRNICESLDYYD